MNTRSRLWAHRVVRISAVYVGVSAGIWQAADVVFEAFDLPAVAIKVLVIGAIAGLPFVAIVAWLTGPELGVPVRARALRGRAVLWTVLFMLMVVVGSTIAVTVRSRPVPPALPFDAVLALAREDFFSGDYEAGAARVRELAMQPDLPRAIHLKALRYQARAAVAAGDETAARATLEAMLELEPPLVFLHPAVESPELMAVFGSVRRSHALAGTPPMTLDSAVFSMGPVVVSGLTAEVSNRELVVGLSNILITELVSPEEGLRMVQHVSSLDAVFSDEADSWSSGPERYYEFLDALGAGSYPQILRETHTISVSLGVRGDRALLSLWAHDLKTASVAAYSQSEGRWPLDLLEMATKASQALIGKLKRPPG